MLRSTARIAVSSLTAAVMNRGKALALYAAVFCSCWGCFYAPKDKPPPTTQTSIELPVPYDLAFQAVVELAKRNHFQVYADDPSVGIVEAQARGFASADADCGEVRTGLGRIAAMPSEDASAVYNFYVAPTGHRSSSVAVQAVFSTPVTVPFHPPQSVTCVSRGTAEKRLLNQVREIALSLHRPAFKKSKE